MFNECLPCAGIMKLALGPPRMGIRFQGGAEVSSQPRCSGHSGGEFVGDVCA